MEERNETMLTGYPNVISYNCSKNIIEQMEKNIFKIKIGLEQGRGFFCKIPFPTKENLLPVLITNNHVINENILYKKDEIININIKNEENIKKINLNTEKLIFQWIPKNKIKPYINCFIFLKIKK